MADQNWIRIRKHLAEKLEQLVGQKLGRKTQALAVYEKEYHQTLNKKWRPSSKEELLESLLEHRLVFVGDFHAIRQSQKSHLRILRSLLGQKELVLAVECFQSKHQAIINSYFNGKMETARFLKKINWQESWGFPWENYRVLFDFVKQHRIPVYALNLDSPSRTHEVLKKRDRHAAQTIKKIRQEHPRATIVATYGDLHLADGHLPSLLREPFVRIFQNYEKLYYQLAKRGLESKIDVMKSAPNDYCILNTAPWVKWQSYIMYLEQNLDFLDGDDEVADPEYTDHVARWVELLATELELKVSSDKLATYTLDDESLYSLIEETYSKKQMRPIVDRLKRADTFYLPSLQAGILGEPSVNHAAHLAAEYVHAQKSKRGDVDSSQKNQFIQAIWIEALAYFGTKLINPNRKSDTFADLQRNLLETHSEFSREALLIALGQKFYEQSGRFKKVKKKSTVLRPRHKSSFQVAAKLLGSMLGEKMYNGYRLGKVKKTRARLWYSSPLDTKEFHEFYYKEITFVDQLPSFFNSKLERL